MKLNLRRAMPAGTLTASLVFVLSSCAMVDEMRSNMNDMRNSTTSMSGTTGRLASNTEVMGDITARMSETVASTYEDMRPGASLDLREKVLQAMDSAESMEAKIAKAAKFHLAFEFQYFKGTGRDTLERREDLLLEAMEEYFREVREFVAKGRNPDTSAGSGDNNMKNLYALAVTMHKITGIQKAHLGHEAKSILNLIEEALLNNVGSGSVSRDQLPAYQWEVLKNEQTAIYLLRLRSNFLAAAAVAELSRMNDGGIGGWFAKIHNYIKSWDAELDHLNYAQILTLNEVLKESIRTRNFLHHQLKHDPKVDGSLLAVYRHMKIQPDKRSEAPVKATLEAKRAAQLRKKAIDELIYSIGDFRAGPH